MQSNPLNMTESMNSMKINDLEESQCSPGKSRESDIELLDLEASVEQSEVQIYLDTDEVSSCDSIPETISQSPTKPLDCSHIPAKILLNTSGRKEIQQGPLAAVWDRNIQHMSINSTTSESPRLECASTRDMELLELLPGKELPVLSVAPNIAEMLDTGDAMHLNLSTGKELVTSKATNIARIPKPDFEILDVEPADVEMNSNLSSEKEEPVPSTPCIASTAEHELVMPKVEFNDDELKHESVRFPRTFNTIAVPELQMLDVKLEEVAVTQTLPKLSCLHKHEYSVIPNTPVFPSSSRPALTGGHMQAYAGTYEEQGKFTPKHTSLGKVLLSSRVTKGPYILNKQSSATGKGKNTQRNSSSQDRCSSSWKTSPDRESLSTKLSNNPIKQDYVTCTTDSSWQQTKGKGELKSRSSSPPNSVICLKKSRSSSPPNSVTIKDSPSITGTHSYENNIIESPDLETYLFDDYTGRIDSRLGCPRPQKTDSNNDAKVSFHTEEHYFREKQDLHVHADVKVNMCADIRFKPVPGFDVMTTLLKPSKLYQQKIKYGTGATVSRQQYCMKRFAFQEKLDCTCMQDNNWKSGYLYQVLLRFCRYDTSHEQDDDIPRDINITVNCKQLQLEARKSNGPIDIKHLCNSKTDNFNYMHLTWSSLENYCVTVSLVRKKMLESEKRLYMLQQNCARTAARTRDDIIRIIGTTASSSMRVSLICPLPSVILVRKLSTDILLLKQHAIQPASRTRALIRKIFSPNKRSLAKSGFKTSLICPMSNSRIRLPCRGNSCKHLQCFNAFTYLQMNRIKPAWLCPLCERKAPFNELVIDGLFIDMLRDVPEKTSEVVFNIDGSWSPMGVT